jgi:hypothetical protein
VKDQFKVHRLNEKGMATAKELAQRFEDLLSHCELVGQPGRELALVATKLEEACFFAKKAMAQKPENQEAEQ